MKVAFMELNRLFYGIHNINYLIEYRVAINPLLSLNLSQ